jgi:ATP phosphoribosyltransferase regulatory subunit
MNRNWMLPEGVDETLPPMSWRLEGLRRSLLDNYRSRGYELIMPPFIEHLDTLLTGAGSDLESQTFKLTDPAGGRLLGLRADMTPQAARIAVRHFAEQPLACSAPGRLRDLR